MTDQEIEAERRAIIKTTVEAMISEGATIAHPTVAARIEKTHPGFAYSVKGGDNFRAMIDDSLPVLPVPTAGALAVIEPTDTAGPAPVIEPEPPGMDTEALREAIHLGELRRGEIRSELFAAQAARGISRQILASALQNFVAGRKIISPTEAALSFCHESAKERESMKAQGRGGHPAHMVRHKSLLDQTLAYQSGGNVDGSDAVRSRFRTGHRRGAVSQAAASDMNQRRALATAAAAKARQQ